MLNIIVGTNRAQSRSAQVAQWLQKKYAEQSQETEIIDVSELGLDKIESPYGEGRPSELVAAVEKINQSEGLIMVVPEYNGSYPGILKYFIDHWAYPKSFEYRPVCFVGLGGRWGGLRPIEHLQGVFGYRNAFMYPERVFISNIWSVFDGNDFSDPMIKELLELQTQGFAKFVDALKVAKLSANYRPQPKEANS